MTKDNKRWNRVQNDCMKLYTGTADRKFVYTDHPYRENINAIDQLMLRAKEYSCSEHLKFFIIAEYVISMRFRQKPEKMSLRVSLGKFEKFTSHKFRQMVQ